MNPSKRGEIRESKKAAALGVLAGWCMKAWAITLRYDVEDRCGVTVPGKIRTPLLLALWHNRIFTIPPVWVKKVGKGRKVVVLTSASHDGATLSRAMAAFGLGSVRGSSSRRAVAALVGMKRALKDGFDVCITPDGPRGPRYRFHPGLIKLAESTATPILPIHVHFTSAWRLKTWDRFVIPKPFSRVRVIFDEMLVVPPSLDEVAFETERVRVEDILRAGADDLHIQS